MIIDQYGNPAPETTGGVSYADKRAVDSFISTRTHHQLMRPYYGFDLFPLYGQVIPSIFVDNLIERLTEELEAITPDSTVGSLVFTENDAGILSADVILEPNNA